jgi:hypothetical protein
MVSLVKREFPLSLDRDIGQLVQTTRTIRSEIRGKCECKCKRKPFVEVVNNNTMTSAAEEKEVLKMGEPVCQPW